MLAVKFPPDEKEEAYSNIPTNPSNELPTDKLDDNFWAPYDPFMPYDQFDLQGSKNMFENSLPHDPYELGNQQNPFEFVPTGDPYKFGAHPNLYEMGHSQDPYDAWKEEFFREYAMNLPPKDCVKEPPYDSLKGPIPPVMGQVPISLEDRYRAIYNQTPRIATSWIMYSIRVFFCILLVVALYCFCNGYQEVKFLEIVNKCLEGHHNPMCEGFMESENTLNDYKSITVQEDMYADRVEWIPKEMSPALEYVTLVSILTRHPCQSLRCLDKLTAQIYGGSENKNGLQQSGQLPNELLVQNEMSREFPDKLDEVLKSMGKYTDAGTEIRQEIIKKNKEYLVMAEFGNASYSTQLRHSINDAFAFEDSHRPPAQSSKHVRDVDGHIKSLIPEVFNERNIILSATSDKETTVAEQKSDKAFASAAKSTNITAPSPNAECLSVVVAERFDCYPEEGASEEACIAKGCCWIPVEVTLKKPNQRTNSTRGSRINPPYCFYPPSFSTYHAIHYQDTPTGQEALLQLKTPSGHPGDVSELRLQFDFETESRLRIQIMPSDGAQHLTPPVLPLTGLGGPPLSGVSSPQETEKKHYSVSLVQQNAGITVTRANSSTTLFSTLGAAPLVFAEQFLQVSSRLASSKVFGLGQHLDGLLLDVSWSRYLMWNADLPPQAGKNLYGSHPFYLVLEDDGKSHGVFFLNANAMDAVLQPSPALTFHSTGGIVTLYILTGPTPSDVISQYTQLVGRPAMPPYWALGYHQCRFNYGSLNGTREVWQRTRDAGIPFDVQWNDLDYMNSSNDFTYDRHTFKGLPHFVEELHQAGMRYVPIIDPGISASEVPGSYPPYDEGINMGIFVRDANGTLPFTGKVWNRKSTVWPDFSHPRAVYYWARQLVRYHGEVHFDGAWIDMNEPSNFLSGSFSGCNMSDPLNRPPYVPAGLVGGALYHKTLCGDASHYIGKHYHLHNLYGLMEAIATNAALKVVRGERPLVISRASFPGLGVWGGHWTGDVWSDWQNLRASVADILNFSLFGVPLVGADICGFNGNTTAPLCLRWMQLGAFYPFSRNHNTDDARAQDPVALGPDVVLASRMALTERYRLLPYLYTLFYLAHSTGATVARPLFVQFPRDPIAHTIDNQFLWGDALMVIPALSENVTSVSAYLPCHSEWFDYYSGRPLPSEGGCHYTPLPAPIDRVPLLLRAGTIVPTQLPDVTTTKSRENPFILYVSLNSAGEASGQLYNDDGVSIDPVQTASYSLLNFHAADEQLVVTSEAVGYKGDMLLDGVRVLGVRGVVERVTINSEPHDFSYDNETKVLWVKDIKWNLPLYFVMRW